MKQQCLIPFMSPAEYRIFMAMQELPHLGIHGMDVVRKLKMSKGTVYVILGRMEKKGYVKSRGSQRRRIYWMTGKGGRVWRAWRTALREWKGA